MRYGLGQYRKRKEWAVAIGRARCDSDGPLPKCGKNVNATQVRARLPHSASRLQKNGWCTKANKDQHNELRT